MSAPPDAKKLKAQLVALREFLPPAPSSLPSAGVAGSAAAAVKSSDGEKDDLDASLTKSYVVLLGAELAQRGVLLTTTTLGGGGISWNDSTCQKLVEVVQSTCGRALLSDGGGGGAAIPRPLLANACSLAGLAAEQCCDFLLACNKRGGDLLTTVEESLWKSTQRRSEEVQDERFSTLLSLRQCLNDEEEEGESKDTRRDSSSSSSSAWPRYFLRVAVGHHLRAATTFANEDQPQPWKRCWDAMVRFQTLFGGDAGSPNLAIPDSIKNDLHLALASLQATTTTTTTTAKNLVMVEAVLPLLALIRVASLKGNDKRVAELQALLSSCYLSALPDFSPKPIQTTKTTTTPAASSLERQIQQAFWIPFLGTSTEAELVQSVLAENDKKPIPIPSRLSLATSTKTARALAMQLVEAAQTAFLQHVKSTAKTTTTRNASQQRVQAMTIALAREQCRVWIQTEEAWGAAKNRMAEQQGVGSGGISLGGGGGASSGSSSNVPNRDPLQKELQDALYWEAYLQEKEAIKSDHDVPPSWNLAAAEQLVMSLYQEALTGVDEDTKDSGGDHWITACCLIHHFLDQRVEMARVVGLKAAAAAAGRKKAKGGGGVATVEDYWQAWKTVASFAILVLQNQKNKDKDKDENVPQLPALDWIAEKAAEVLVMAAWMLPPSDENDKGILVETSMPLETLTFWNNLRTQSVDAQRAQREAASLIGERDADKNHQEQRHVTVAAALQSAHCRWRMMTTTMTSSPANGDGTSIHEVPTNHHNNSKKQTLDATFGTALWQCLLSWCGLHSTSWPTCTVTEARMMVRQAQESLERAGQLWGRPMSPEEQLLLDLARADAEGGYLAGGYLPDATLLYRRVHQQLMDDSALPLRFPPFMKTLLVAHCKAGLSRVAYASSFRRPTPGVLTATAPAGDESADDLARSSLQLVESLRDGNDGVVWYWSHGTFGKRAVAHQISTARQTLSKVLLQQDKRQEALELLTFAVRDAPADVEARLALGAFHLYLELYVPQQQQQQKQPMAQVTLLQAAKLDPKRSDPFALLGLYYEVQRDAKRAVGCYSKALVLHAANPIAGRGLLRLCPFASVGHLCHKATTTTTLSTALVGWAWWALGRSQALLHGKDEAAVECFQKALTCRDVGQAAKAVHLAEFYQLPSQEEEEEQQQEIVLLWCDLAASFQRVGKFYAALRAYHMAVEEGGGGATVISANMLCDWAEAELNLGLHEQAISRIDQAMAKGNAAVSRVGMYIRGLASLSYARQLTMEGKYSASLAVLEASIRGLQSQIMDSSAHVSRCEWKLLGDICSFAASLRHDRRSSLELCRQGEEAYRKGLEHLQRKELDKAMALQLAAAHCDVGMSLLQQVQGSDMKTNEGKALQERAISSWLQAMDQDPCFPPAWSGLGCSLMTTNPILSQHALVRCLELDRLHGDAWLMLCVLCAAWGATQPSLTLMDASAEVMETSVAWILRALLLDPKPRQEEETLDQVADAYRSALQRQCHSLALLGLSVVMMRRNAAGEKRSSSSLVESRAAFQTYHSARFGDNTDDVGRSFGFLLSAQDAVERFFKQGSLDSAQEVLQSALRDSTNVPSGNDEGETTMSKAAGAVVRQVADTLLGSVASGKNTIRPPSLQETKRLLRENPTDALQWLQFAHGVLRQMLSSSHAGQSRGELSLDEVTRAANRALLLLSEEVTRPCSREATTTSGDKKTKTHESAKMLSQAVALSSACRSAAAPEEASTTCAMQMQQALMLDPTNAVARAWAARGGFGDKDNTIPLS